VPRAKRNLKVKRPSKVVTVAGIAGAFLASSTSRSVANVLPQSMAPFQVLNLGEEEISDVTLATFHFVDGESPETLLPRVQLARGDSRPPRHPIRNSTQQPSASSPTAKR
jgi:hypothetical protein